MTNHRDPTLAEHLREQYEDIRELYEAAKLNENAPQMEKLSKVMAGMVKQIKEQELHERESLKRDEVRKLANLIGIMIGRSVKEHVTDQTVATIIIESILFDIDQMVEDKTI
jgi:hypothetical protein